MRCHSTPNKAPKELVTIYGDTNGFYETEGTIRALISTEYPLGNADQFVVKSTLFLAMVTLVIFVFFIFIYSSFSRKLLQTNSELKSLNETLEDKVKAETYALETSNTQLQSVINGSDLGYWDWNLKTGYYEVNQKWLDILGLRREDIKNNQSDWEDRINQEDKQKIMPIIEDAIENNKTYTVEFRMRHKDGYDVWIEGAGSVIQRDSGSNPLRACGTHKDISQRKEDELTLKKKHKQLQKAQKELKKLVVTDKLTNIYNRHKLDSIIVKEKKRSDRYNTSFGIIILDIDHFKNVNDTYGHHVGDEVLQEFANILLTHSRETDIVGRWGGEEFLIIVPQTDKGSMLKFAENLRGTIQEYHFKTVENITSSFGVAVYKNKETVEDTINRADAALYVSKNSGRNQVNFE
jgi:diguanylate cyclase (GGDEF)-like protein/PAS domain S-box-containing protein